MATETDMFWWQTCNVTPCRKILECVKEATSASVAVVGLHHRKSYPKRCRGTPDHALSTKYIAHVEIPGFILPQIASETLDAPESCTLYQEVRSGIPHKPGQTQIQSFISWRQSHKHTCSPFNTSHPFRFKGEQIESLQIKKKKHLTDRWGDKT